MAQPQPPLLLLEAPLLLACYPARPLPLLSAPLLPTSMIRSGTMQWASLAGVVQAVEVMGQVAHSAYGIQRVRQHCREGPLPSSQWQVF
jgi:hypothetical protein